MGKDETADTSTETDTNEAAMPRDYADVVVGGQAGSEGKGAVVAHLIRTGDYGASVRPGSSNAGHTVYTKDGDNGWESYIHQVIPSAATVDGDVACYMAPESSFGLDEFFEEYQDMADRWGSHNARLRVAVDPKAAVITGEHRHEEADRKLGDDIGSTVHGCGAVRVEKIWRSAGDVRLAENYDALNSVLAQRHLIDAPGDAPEHPGIDRVPALLRRHGELGERVLVEGTQGTLLSMNQSPHWPFSTSRDCTASAFLSSCGLPPSATGNVWAVFRTYPIRVGGHSGPLDSDEIDFETIAERAGHDEPPVEFTSVTKKKRRIFEWSWRQFEFAVQLNDPDLIAVTFLDYLDADNYGARGWWDLTRDTREWVHRLHDRAQDENGSAVALLKTGPLPEHTIDLRVEGGHGEEPWVFDGLPPVSPEQDGKRWRPGPDDNWFGYHPTPGVNYPSGECADGNDETLSDGTNNDIVDAVRMAAKTHIGNEGDEE